MLLIHDTIYLTLLYLTTHPSSVSLKTNRTPLTSSWKSWFTNMWYMIHSDTCDMIRYVCRMMRILWHDCVTWYVIYDSFWYVWYDSLCVSYDSFCGMTLICVIRFTDMFVCDIIHWYVWHHSSMTYFTSLYFTFTTHSWHDLLTCIYFTFILLYYSFMTWFTDMCDTIHSFMCDTTHACVCVTPAHSVSVSHDSFCACVTWPIRGFYDSSIRVHGSFVCPVTHVFDESWTMTHAFECVPWLIYFWMTRVPWLIYVCMTHVFECVPWSPDPINHVYSLPGKYISKRYFTYRSIQIFKIMFRGFILKIPTKIWSSAQDHALLDLLLNTVGFFISARQKSASWKWFVPLFYQLRRGIFKVLALSGWSWTPRKRNQ